MGLLSSCRKPASFIGTISFNSDNNPMTRAFSLVENEAQGHEVTSLITEPVSRRSRCLSPGPPVQAYEGWAHALSLVPICLLGPHVPAAHLQTPQHFSPLQTLGVCVLLNFPSVNHAFKWLYHREERERNNIEHLSIQWQSKNTKIYLY